MMYLGYDFTDPIPDKENLPSEVQCSLSIASLDKAKEFLISAKEFIAKELDLFSPPSKLKSDKVAMSILENYTGNDGYPSTEEKQAWHTDYDAKG